MPSDNWRVASGEPHAIPRRFCKCAQESEMKRVALDFAAPVCAKSAEAVEKKEDEFRSCAEERKSEARAREKLNKLDATPPSFCMSIKTKEMRMEHFA